MGNVIEVNFRGAIHKKYDWEEVLWETVNNHSKKICSILDTVDDEALEVIDILTTNIHSQIALFVSYDTSDPLGGDLEKTREFMHWLVDSHFDDA